MDFSTWELFLYDANSNYCTEAEVKELIKSNPTILVRSLQRAAYISWNNITDKYNFVENNIGTNNFNSATLFISQWNGNSYNDKYVDSLINGLINPIGKEFTINKGNKIKGTINTYTRGSSAIASFNLEICFEDTGIYIYHLSHTSGDYDIYINIKVTYYI